MTASATSGRISRWAASGRRTPLVLFALWTLFIWGTRLRNAFTDDELVGGARAGAFVIAGVFVIGALGCGVIAFVRRRESVGRPGAGMTIRGGAVSTFAGFTIGYWAYRMVRIALNDHSLAFIAVHAVLAGGSMALAAWVLRALRDTGIPPGPGSVRADSPL